MKDSLRQMAVGFSVLATIVINALANALPINGVTTGEVSDSFQVYFVPAGYVFSIWGLIYLGLTVHAVYQLLPGQRTNPRFQRTGWWIVLSGLANSTWIFLWHHHQFSATLAVMLVLLIALIVIYLRLGIGRHQVSSAETWLARVPFSIYLGWITVATIANASVVLVYLSWGQWGLSEETWMIVMLAAVVVILGLNSITRRDVAYGAVILWALAGIGVKHSDAGRVTIATWIAFAAALVLILLGRLRRDTT